MLRISRKQIFQRLTGYFFHCPEIKYNLWNALLSRSKLKLPVAWEALILFWRLLDSKSWRNGGNRFGTGDECAYSNRETLPKQEIHLDYELYSQGKGKGKKPTYIQRFFSDFLPGKDLSRSICFLIIRIIYSQISPVCLISACRVTGCILIPVVKQPIPGAVNILPMHQKVQTKVTKYEASLLKCPHWLHKLGFHSRFPYISHHSWKKKPRSHTTEQIP